MTKAEPESRDKQQTIRLLLVDDEEAYVDVPANRLGRRGFDVTKTYSGTQALQAMRGKEFDVAVLDLKMEDMDGIEVLKVVKRMDPKMQVIMLTGHGSETAAKQGMEFGAFDYLMKPCELDALVEKNQGGGFKVLMPDIADPAPFTLAPTLIPSDHHPYDPAASFYPWGFWAGCP